MPFTYRHASDEFHAYLKDMRGRTLIGSDNVIYTAAEAVLCSFRARLGAQQALRFADELPAVLRDICLALGYSGTASAVGRSRNDPGRDDRAALPP